MKKNLFYKIFIFISFVIVFLSIYIKKDFNNISFEQLLFSLYTSSGSSKNAILDGVIFVFLGSLVCSFITYLSIKLFRVENKYKLISCISIIFSLVFILGNIGFFGYVVNNVESTSIYDREYVDPKDVNITFPNKKQNLIYIIVESLESTAFSKENGGTLNESYIPNLETFALHNDSFSNTETLGGAFTLDGLNWTAASMMGQTSGVNLKVSFKDIFRKEILSNTYSIGDVLKDAGYNNYLMMGSLSEFGKRDEYFKTHGSYTIYDYKFAKEDNLIDKDYNVWWGYEDSKLYEFAKEKLLTISKEEKPFNFTMLTADTHFIDGYVDPICEMKFASHYANSYYCTDYMIGNFVNWIKEQDFYENTTIVIVGDHLTMQSDLYELNKDYDRGIYNTIINSKAKSSTMKNRKFSMIDFYPTTLAALGCNIEGEHLALGVNLYSKDKTLIEKYSYLKVNEEFSKKSEYYNKNIR